jgi:phenylacetate-CoA ligase
MRVMPHESKSRGGYGEGERTMTASGPHAATFTERLQAFIGTNLDQLIEPQPVPDPERAAVALFQRVAVDVPAYREFLAGAQVDPRTIRDATDFARLPLITKSNYVQRYPLAARCRGGKLESCDMVAVSSGSTGTPTVWPRSLDDELAIAARFEQIFSDSFAAGERRTLAVICFALGTWVGGLFTLSCCRWLAAKGYPITAVAPGNNKAEIWRVVKALAPAFDQTVLLGYPPFLKDVIDGGLAEEIDWRALSVKFVMAGEVFSEEWRDLVGERSGAVEPCYASASLYGTADAGVLGNETPLSIAIRRFLAREPKAARALFGESRLPTLVQYDPLSRYFETVDGTLLFSGDNGVPLIRYHIADKGGIVGYDEMLRFVRDWGADPIAELLPQGGRGVRRLPFVYVFGRADFTVSFFGANVFPENVTVGLEQPGISAWVTGKFVLQVIEGLEANPRLAIAVELADGVEATTEIENGIAGSILAALLRLNSEFANYVPAEHRHPEITLKRSGDPEWFPSGVKHRYTRR